MKKIILATMITTMALSGAASAGITKDCKFINYTKKKGKAWGIMGSILIAAGTLGTANAACGIHSATK